MRAPVRSTAFKKDVKRMAKRGKKMAKLKAVIGMLLAGEPLDPRLRDHPLKGEWAGWRDLHIEPDWLLLYRMSETELLLARTGTHSDLFGE
ncbi:type II toxin-antitoxin system YafQ family toxin [Parasphingopyxis algicola]|uniref:type II toxin-antitoxin system RelE/ParE family toxin n=1 Tax=Parasphingopyxis algicola TaxID=2026624 RepID=UPI0015A36F03|nr:type II toxin-antitoxin system YafQ family toxin [Parasphingopyxis algicola]QLC26256.1 type II toxin-antitoxin system YafQ family toxin [Parasphingopyxis algicola]